MSSETLHQRLIKLGDLIAADPVHVNSWVKKEYKRTLEKIQQLDPELQAAKKAYLKKKRQEAFMFAEESLKKNLWKCTCGAALKVLRRGSKTLICVDRTCGNRFDIVRRKTGK